MNTVFDTLRAERVLGFGGAGIGNLYRQMSDGVARQTLQAAWNGGVRYFDTAPHYGLGLSERRIGEFLADKPREDFLISTKVGRLIVPNPDYRDGQTDDEGFDVPKTSIREWDPSESGIRRSLEESLERLGLDSVDILYLHDPDVYDLEAGIAQGLPALEKLRSEGLVKAIGVGANTVDTLVESVRRADLDLIMLAGRYTLLEQPAAETLLPLCSERGVGVVNVGVYNSGLLARDEVPEDANYNYAQAPAAIIERARRLAAVCHDFGVSLPAAAVQFSYQNPVVAAVALGASSAGQMDENLRRFDADIPAELWDALAKV
ncbi:aldo/keto reductase [Haematomicrobium sanguinis]|uniref:aldo/keto reductase n=1 Tax=Haematomicrobium sanguinis TaxID=479106 RepID=UPI0005538FD9|nr:aldo/keto reductase [Haematomicrobium sanguinis]